MWSHQHLSSHTFLPCDIDSPPSRPGVCVPSPWIWVGLWLQCEWCPFGWSSSKWISFPYSLGALQTADFYAVSQVGKSILGPISNSPPYWFLCQGLGSHGYNIFVFPTHFYAVLLYVVTVWSALRSSLGGIALYVGVDLVWREEEVSSGSFYVAVWDPS